MTPLAVVAYGMVSPLGFNGPATLAALRAGVSAIRELPWPDPESGEPLRGAKIDLPHWSEEVRTLADMAAASIEECLAGIEPAERRAIPILIGVAAPQRAGRHAGLEAELLEGVAARMGGPLHPASAAFPADQTGCIRAIVEAARLMESGRVRLAVVCGVDSLLRQESLDAYAERMRLMTPANSNGFFPGEAAAAVLVTDARGEGADRVVIAGLGFALETATIESAEPFQAVGLTSAVKQALSGAGVSMSAVDYRLTDLSGEHYKFKEATFVAVRLDRGERQAELDVWHPIEYLGEIGAAIVPCLLAWALHAAQHGYQPGPCALCHVGSDAGERAALVLRTAVVLRDDET